MKRMILVLAVMALSSGCAVHKEWNCIGGSKADGSVRLSYDYHMFEQPVVDNAQGVELATRRCLAWGYTGAEAFGATTQTCINFGQSGCTSWRATADFQCTGGK